MCHLNEDMAGQLMCTEPGVRQKDNDQPLRKEFYQLDFACLELGSGPIKVFAMRLPG